MSNTPTSAKEARIIFDSCAKCHRFSFFICRLHSCRCIHALQ